MSTARKIFSNTLAQIIGKVLTAVLGLASIKIGTYYLSVEGFGQYSLVYEFLAFFGIAADLGLFTIAVKEMSENEDQIPKIIGNILFLRTLLVILTMLAAILAVFLIPKYADTKIPLGVTIASLTVFFTILNGTTTTVLQTKLKMGIASLATILGKLVSVGFMLYVVFVGFPNDKENGFYMLIVAGIFGALLTYLTTNYYVRKITPLKYRFDKDLWKDVLKKSLPYGIALLLNTIYFRIDSILISLIRDQHQVGIYAVAMKMLEQFTILPLYFMNSVLPVLTKAIKEGTEKYKIIIGYAFDFLTAMAMPLVVGGFVLAYPIVFIIATPEFLTRLSEGFYGSDMALKVLIFALMFQFLNVLFAFILIAVNKQVKLLYINAFGVLINIGLNLLVIAKYSFMGAAATSVISEAYILIATYFLAKKYLPFKINFKNLFKIMLSAVVMGFIVYYLQKPTYVLMQNWNILLLVAVGAITYVAMLFLTKTVNRDMLQLLKNK